MDEWRPEGWDSLQAIKQIPTSQLQSDSAHEMLQSVFEAGADAMVQALKEKGAWMTPEQMKLLAPDRKYPYGHLVFIPESERTVDEICKTGARKEIFAGYYGDDNIPKICPYCNGEVVLRRKSINQEDTVPVGICARCDIAWVTKDRN